ncbi:hypothetical protein MMC28_001909 [Mycoblastus sanguinarius]|nr:hypothetical protein [Mycoblastus sanguinarius]
MSAPGPSAPGPSKTVYSEEELAEASASFEQDFGYDSSQSYESFKEREVQKMIRRKRRRAKHAVWWLKLEEMTALQDTSMRRLPLRPNTFCHLELTPCTTEENSDDIISHPPNTVNELPASLNVCSTARDSSYNIPLSPSVDVLSGESEADSLDDNYKDNLARRGIQEWTRYRCDHPRACGGAFVRTPSQPFRFMDLPPEIRIMILRLLLRWEQELTAMDADQEHYCDYLPLDVRIFAVSRIMQAEAEQVFYQGNTLRIYLDDHLPMSIRRASKSKTPTSLQWLKRIRIVILRSPKLTATGLDESYRDQQVRKAKILVDALKHCTRLVQVKITSFINEPEDDLRLDEHFNELLDEIATLKGVEDVFSNEGTFRLKKDFLAVTINTPAESERMWRRLFRPSHTP